MSNSARYFMFWMIITCITMIHSRAFAQFQATPLIDAPTAFYTPNPASGVSFRLGLYLGSNLPPAAHAAALRAAAAQIIPLCQNGLPPTSACAEGGIGRIGFAEFGLSVSLQQTATGLTHASGESAPLPSGATPGTANSIFYGDQQATVCSTHL